MRYTLIKPTQKNYSPLVQVLTNRGIDVNEIEQFLNPDESCIHDPKGLKNIEIAARTILAHFLKGNRIHIQVDSDCDGYTSAAVLINYLYRLLPTYTKNNISYSLHEDKHHGIGEVPEGVTLVIAPDSSSNENELHKELASKNIQVVILDHHHSNWDEEDPAIIVNNQMCDYPNKTLSGVGIVYKTCQVLDSLTHRREAEEFLDLVALGMTADMMDTREFETRKLILDGFKQVQNPFFYKMIEKQDFSMKGKVNQHTVAWYIAPYINAITRTGTNEEKLLIFEAMLEHKAHLLIPSTKRGCKGQEELLVEQAIRACTNVKSRQEKQKSELLDFIRNTCDYNGSPIWSIILPEGRFHGGLTGLVANQLMSEYGVPVLLLHERNSDGIITYEGSGRGFDTGFVKDWRLFCEEHHALYAEGHAMAFGVGFTQDGYNNFVDEVEYMFGGKSTEKNYDVDFIWKWSDNFDNTILDLGNLGEDVWGQGVKEPYVIIEKIPVSSSNIQLMGKGTVRIDIPGCDTNCIKFGAMDMYEIIMARLGTGSDTTIDITLCGNCAVNKWNGEEIPQIRIVDYDITSGPKWNF